MATLAPPTTHRAKRPLRATTSASAVLTSSEAAAQRYGIEQDLIGAVGNVGMKIRQNVSSGYQRPPPASSSLSDFPPIPFLSPSSSSTFSRSQSHSSTFLSASETLSLAHTQHAQQLLDEQARRLKPEKGLRGYWEVGFEGAEREDDAMDGVRVGGGLEFGIGMEEESPNKRGKKRATTTEEDGEVPTDTEDDTPQTRSTHMHAWDTKPRATRPMRRAPMRATQSLPASAFVGAGDVDMEDGFNVADWAGREDF